MAPCKDVDVGLSYVRTPAKYLKMSHGYFLLLPFQITSPETCATCVRNTYIQRRPCSGVHESRSTRTRTRQDTGSSLEFQDISGTRVLFISLPQGATPCTVSKAAANTDRPSLSMLHPPAGKLSGACPSADGLQASALNGPRSIPSEFLPIHHVSLNTLISSDRSRLLLHVMIVVSKPKIFQSSNLV
jgi:hypothetical protein